MNNVRNLYGVARKHAPKLLPVALAAVALLGPELAWAGSAQGMPWESPLQKFVDSITGPVAMGVSVLGVIATVGGLIWGGEMNDFLRKGIMMVLGISGIVFATNIITTLFGANGAVIASLGAAVGITGLA